MKSEPSIQVDDQLLINSFTDDIDFPYLISFPRTGSHWLRVLMELYFNKPSLVRVFFYFDAKEYTCMHKHDDDLEISRKNVIYLYRDPVPTVFSQMKYYGQDIDDRKHVQHWSNEYRDHMLKWLVREEFTEKKTVITYEGMRKDLGCEFMKVCAHFDMEFIPDRLREALLQSSKGTIKQKTTHDLKVVSSDLHYENEREQFIRRNGDEIMSIMLHGNNELEKYINR